jgi:hypothetical protein
MASLSRIRTALGAALESLPKAKIYSRLTAVTEIPNGGIAIVVGKIESDFTGAMARGLTTHTIELYALASLRDHGLATDDMDRYVDGAGEYSIRNLLFDRGRAPVGGLGLLDSNGEVDADFHVPSITGYGGQFEDAGIDHLGCIVNVICHTSGLP